INSEMQKIQSMQATANKLVAHQLNYTRSTPTHFSVGKASGSIADMISASKQWIGNSVYVFGGGRTQAQIQNGVFDCSSFVHWAYSQIGVNVGWSTSSLSHEGTAVSSSSMQPGDLVFFNTYKHNGHVGIYIGGGQFIGAQSSSGVSIESLSNPYWSAHFSGTVRRIIH
ncbi:MAG TPA: C40 family peptidase, partial [Bacillales bacterium]|nr:C40 family peptidase [Bacillales bacterium]